MDGQQLLKFFFNAYIAPLIRQAIREELKSYFHQFNTEKKPEEEFLTAPEAAKFIGDALQTFYGRTSRGEFTTYGSGKKILIRKSDLLAWREKKRTKSKSDLDEEVNDFLTNKSKKGKSLKMKLK